MKKLMGDQDHIRENLYSYIQAFSPAVRDVFEHFDFHTQVERLSKAGLLYQVTERFAQFDLHPEAVDNPVNESGYRTAYLWERVWARESWLEILGRYLVCKRDSKKQITSIVFPRYHQLDATRQLMAAVLAEGPGQKYLIQHSAGSGKTNSIAWTAHFLADLHDAEHRKLFDSVLVVSDRTVLDSQLQEAIFDFERTAGVVATIKGEAASKSAELAKALSGGKKIVVCTIQTFPFALKAVQELAATEGKRFAVIADEAHSSQTGEHPHILVAGNCRQFKDVVPLPRRPWASRSSFSKALSRRSSSSPIKRLSRALAGFGRRIASTGLSMWKPQSFRAILIAALMMSRSRRTVAGLTI